ncbi:CD74 molecule, major histocompatibility complex, class II invariant chain a [Parambassis ranga]|uniref:CD74 molecule, major histocompatibility complex, class II invariant chain a n=1 Tax=Parambassis ranga TaxID=210632 RepID=A0A6P7J770_9TELE|nr:HLA class II histocompatibility antigen gamma chain [Parambassis ranga]
MANPEETAPMARERAGSEEVLIVGAAPRGGSNSRALKIAGLTTLACLLLASQVFTAYMVFDQKQQIHTLQKSSERMGRQMTRSSPGGVPMRMAMPMNTLPLLKDFSDDENSKTPLTKLQNTATVSVEKQVKDLLQDANLPQFNQTFLANLQNLKQQMEEGEWKKLESWMHYWLIFQMAQEKPPAAPTQPALLIKTKCQMEAAPGGMKIGSYKPQCDEEGKYKPMQCWHATGFCWCVDEQGNVIEGTSMRGRPDCRKGSAPRRLMAAPMLMQKTLDVDDQ